MPVTWWLCSSANRKIGPSWSTLSPATIVGTSTARMFVRTRFSNMRSFCVQQRLAAQRQIHLVAHPVELQVQRVQPRVLAAAGEVVVGEPGAVRGHLDVIEAHLAGHAQDLEELRVQRRLATRELDVAAGLGLALHQGAQHAAARSRDPGSSRCRWRRPRSRPGNAGCSGWSGRSPRAAAPCRRPRPRTGADVEEKTRRFHSSSLWWRRLSDRIRCSVGGVVLAQDALVDPAVALDDQRLGRLSAREAARRVPGEDSARGVRRG